MVQSHGVAEASGKFFTLVGDWCNMYPEVSELFMVEAPALGHFVCVVGEDKVLTTYVDV